ncbi:MAG: response regulator [Chloroflexi bacterium]|nr:response regulator [Chloroflexota bacterium]
MPSARILVVEDESIVAMDIQTRLGRLGYSVVGVAASAEGAIAKAGETRPDLVLMDIRLEGEMDGIEAAGRIRSDFNIPVVYVTAYADEETLQRAKVTEPFGYILKPFETRELFTTIEMGLCKHKGEQALLQKNQELEQRVLELSALNTMFQQHLDLSFDAEEHYRELHGAVCTFLGRLGELTAELEGKSQVQPSPTQVGDMQGQ